MSHKRPSTLAPLPITLVLLAILIVPSLYVVGYFWLGERVEMMYWSIGPYPQTTVTRQFSRPWLVTLYKPAGQVESWLSGVPIYVTRESSWVEVF